MKHFENEQLRPSIIEELVFLEIQDFGAGFHQPTWCAILVVKMADWPISIGKEVAWLAKYYLRRLTSSQ